MNAIQKGDWVRTEDGQVGLVVLVDRVSAFVQIEGDKKTTAIAFLLSTLTKIERTEDQRDG